MHRLEPLMASLPRQALRPLNRLLALERQSIETKRHEINLTYPAIAKPAFSNTRLGAGPPTTAVNIFGHHRKAVFPRFLEELFSE
jgi:hypothetical protein